MRSNMAYRIYKKICSKNRFQDRDLILTKGMGYKRKIRCRFIIKLNRIGERNERVWMWGWNWGWNWGQIEVEEDQKLRGSV